MKLNEAIERLMTERFGKDAVIALATADGNIPYVRNVDAYYENGAFYVITYALSDKMKQIGRNPNVAVAGEWFTARGTCVNMGWFRRAENREIADKLRTVFAEWIDNGHNNFDDENTVILCIRLETGRLFSEGKAYEIEF
ncbi:MAG: pyridoxamine 5'-phosphate oxidase family protein [Butyrivibrio sp.]|nr:pyridoxamine 5'-phosphate oxidase family protein [Butyrivibrio sp.]